VLDRSQTDMLTRTVVTTVTTLLAALMLYVFTEGGSRDFSLALMVGMVSGVYSTIYIAGGCIALISRGKSGGQLLGL
ncbi:protein translocase subunit SecF, partial [Treponema pallidum]